MTSSLATKGAQENVQSSSKFQLLGELQFILILSSLLVTCYFWTFIFFSFLNSVSFKSK